MLPSLFDPGDMMSYCNIGFAVLGRITEIKREMSWDDALKKHLYDPLAMTHAISKPGDTLRFNSAIGHIESTNKNGKLRVTDIPYLSIGQKAAGATPAMTASDLLKFAQMHLRGGTTPDGKRILKAASVKAMQKPQIKMLKHTPLGLTHWGLGWFLLKWGDEKLYGHDGATIGQFAFMRILPSKNMAVVLLTNGGDAKGLYKSMFNDIFKDAAKLTEPELPASLNKQPDVTPFAGTYQNITTRIELTASRNTLYVQPFGIDSGQALEKKKSRLTFLSPAVARVDVGDDVKDRQSLLFSGFDQTGRPRFVQTGFRQFKRVGGN